MIFGKYLIGILCAVALVACTQPPSTEELDKEIAAVKESVKLTKSEFESYRGGVIKVLIAVRLETLNNTLAALEQKKSGINRFIKFNYTVNGAEYIPPPNKLELIKEIDQDIALQEKDLLKAEAENSLYSGGLVKVLIVTRVETIKNMITLLRVRKLLLRNDMPLIMGLPGKNKQEKEEPEFKQSPGSDNDKL